MRSSSSPPSPPEQPTDKVVPLQPKAEFSSGNGAAPPVTVPTTSAPPRSASQPTPETDKAVLDERERLLADTILDADDGDTPDDIETNPPLVKKLPKFANFRASPVTFDLWGTTDQQGMDELLFTTTKSFAPEFEDDVELRRVRIFETVTAGDGIVRLVYCFVPERMVRGGGGNGNNWGVSKLAALEHAQHKWTAMRSLQKLGQYTFRPSRKDYGEAKFSGLTPLQHIENLKKDGTLITNKDHPFFKKATDTE